MVLVGCRVSPVAMWVVLDFETEECLAQPDAWLLVLGFCLAVNRVLSLQVSGVLYKFSPRSQQA